MAPETPTDPLAGDPPARGRTGAFLRGVVALACLGAAVGLGVLLWREVLRPRLVAKRWGVVVPGKIYRSGQLSRFLVEEMLVDNGIQVVVNLNHLSLTDPDQVAEADAVARHSIESHRFHLEGDGTGDIREYAKALAVDVEAEEQGRPVLIHCAAGAQRTGALVVYYRVLIQKRPPADAYTELLAYDWLPKNTILLEYTNENMERLATLLEEGGTLSEVPKPRPVIGPPLPGASSSWTWTGPWSPAAAQAAGPSTGPSPTGSAGPTPPRGSPLAA